MIPFKFLVEKRSFWLSLGASQSFGLVFYRLATESIVKRVRSSALKIWRGDYGGVVVTKWRGGALGIAECLAKRKD